MGKREVLAAGKDKHARSISLVYNALQVGGQVRRILNLIEDGSIGELGEVAAGVFGGESSSIGILECLIGQLRERFLGECCFPGLARPCNREYGIAFEEAMQVRLKRSR